MVHHAAEVTRVEKIAVLAERPDVLGTLKVCDELDDPRRNCGRCGKCTRTMVGLEIAGVLGEAPFEAPLTQRGVARIPVAASIEREFGYELLPALSARAAATSRTRSRWPSRPTSRGGPGGGPGW